jgi:hypothetical protein
VRVVLIECSDPNFPLSMGILNFVPSFKSRNGPAAGKQHATKVRGVLRSSPARLVQSVCRTVLKALSGVCRLSSVQGWC